MNSGSLSRNLHAALLREEYATHISYRRSAGRDVLYFLASFIL
jgi:hypothetical protein